MSLSIKLSKLFLAFFVIIVLMVLWQYFDVGTYLSFAGFSHYYNDILFYNKLHPYLFIAWFVILYVLIISSCIPGTIFFDLLAGGVFGVFYGSILVIFSYLIGSCTNFLIVRYFLKDILKNKFNKFKAFIHGDGKFGLLLNLIGLRLIVVIPFWVLNIIAALINIKMRTFIISTLIGTTPISIIYVVMGKGIHDSIIQGHELNTAVVTNPRIWIPLLCIALIMILPTIIKSIKKQHIK